MKSIRIIRTPPGEPPKWVRKEWIGVEIPLPEQEPDGVQMGALGGEAKNTDGYQVKTREAVKALQKKSPKAADWWDKNTSLALTTHLVFSKSVCEVISNQHD